MATGTVGQYKVAYAKPKEYSALYSVMCDTLSEAKSIAHALDMEGCRVVIMEAIDMSKSASGEYAWKILPLHDGKKIRAGMIVTDARFWFVAVGILLAAWWLSRSRYPIRIASNR